MLYFFAGVHIIKEQRNHKQNKSSIVKLSFKLVDQS